MNRISGFLILALVAALVLGSSAYVIDQAEQGIVVQFGEPVGEPVTPPGLHWKLPFIQDVRRFDKRLLVWDGDVNPIPTLGREFVIVDTTARWRSSDPLMRSDEQTSEIPSLMLSPYARFSLEKKRIQ